MKQNSPMDPEILTALQKSFAQMGQHLQVPNELSPDSMCRKLREQRCKTHTSSLFSARIKRYALPVAGLFVLIFLFAGYHLWDQRLTDTAGGTGAGISSSSAMAADGGTTEMGQAYDDANSAPSCESAKEEGLESGLLVNPYAAESYEEVYQALDEIKQNISSNGESELDASGSEDDKTIVSSNREEETPAPSIRADSQNLYIANPTSGRNISLISLVNRSLQTTIAVGQGSLLDFSPSEDRLAVITGENAMEPSLTVSIYDLSNTSTPSLLTSYQQDSDYLASFVGADYLYVVGQQKITASTGASSLPAAFGTQGERLPYENYLLIPNEQTTYFTTVSSINLQTGETAETMAFLGNCAGIYFSEDSLYAAFATSQNETGQTVLFRFALEQGRLDYSGSCVIEGNLCQNDGQPALAEYNAYLYAVSTWEEGVCLTVFDEEMIQVSQVENILPVASPISATFAGRMAYLSNASSSVVVDLSDPSAPLMMTSSEENTLLTAVAQAEEYYLLEATLSGETNSTLLLLNNADPPDIVSEMEINGEIDYTGAASFKQNFLNYSEDLFCVPTNYQGRSSYLVLSAENSELQLIGEVTATPPIEGGVLTDQALYLVEGESLVEYNIQDLSQNSSVVLP